MKHLFVITVTQLVNWSELCMADRQEDPAGHYVYFCDSEKEALDAFHSTVPLKTPEHFDVSCEEAKGSNCILRVRAADDLAKESHELRNKLQAIQLEQAILARDEKKPS